MLRRLATKSATVVMGPAFAGTTTVLGPVSSKNPPPARVSMDGRESICCVHPSRRLLRKLLRMRSVFTLTQHLPKLQTFVGMSVTPRIEGHLIFKNPDVLGASGMRVALPTL